MSRFIRKRRTHRSRFWLAVFGVMTLGLFSFCMFDDDDGYCCDNDNDNDNDDQCDCDEDCHAEDHEEGHDWWQEARKIAWRAEREEYELLQSSGYRGDMHELQREQQRKAKAERERLEKKREEQRQRENQQWEQKRLLRRKRTVAFLLHRKRIQVGVDARNLVGLTTAKAQQMLSEQAFTNIKFVPVQDIGPNTRLKAGTVKEVTISGENGFIKADMFPYDAPIVIYFHDKIDITVPFPAKSLRGKNYLEVCDQFRALGFTRIHKYPKRDVVIGWLSKLGETESVSINGDSRFRENAVYKFDVEITVRYHASITDRGY